MTDAPVPPRAWPVFATYVAAFLAIVALSGLAAVVVTSLYPDVAPVALLNGLPGLLAGGVASSVALVLTLMLTTRNLEPAQLRLVPGRETGRDLAVMILGMLALGQALDSLTSLIRVDHQGTMWQIREALAGAQGEVLFAAVVVIGPLAGTAEEVFFRGFMQTRLRAVWSPGLAVLATSACFGLMHLDLLHGALAFVLGLYLGFITERAGSALPAVVSHIVNNVLFTLLTALVAMPEGRPANAILLAVSALVFGGCLLWLVWRPLPATPGG